MQNWHSRTDLVACMRSKGKITSWNDDKGFGFITPVDGGKQVFMHVKALRRNSRRPEVSDVVTYALSKDKRGRPCAANATLAGDKLKEKVQNRRNSFAIFFALAFLCAVGASVLAGTLPRIILLVYAVLSLVTFIAYAIDKSAAKSGRWRTSEATLQLCGLVGGWPGALIAQQTLRHKSKKTSFRVVLWINVFLNCGAIVWLHTASGRVVLYSLLGGYLFGD